jgi:hypothetical protein
MDWGRQGRSIIECRVGQAKRGPTKDREKRMAGPRFACPTLPQIEKLIRPAGGDERLDPIGFAGDNCLRISLLPHPAKERAV